MMGPGDGPPDGAQPLVRGLPCDLGPYDGTPDSDVLQRASRRWTRRSVWFAGIYATVVGSLAVVTGVPW